MGKATAKLVPSKVSDDALGTMVKEALAANQSAAVSVTQARVLSAQATYVAVESGRIGKAGLWDSQKSYAVDLGTSASNVTALKRIGHALAKGFDPFGKDADLWGILSNRVNRKDLAAVLDDSTSTITAIRHAVEQAREPLPRRAGDRAPEPLPGGPDGDSAGGSEGGNAEVTDAPAGETPDERATRLLGLFSEAAKEVSAEGWPEVENAIQAILTRELTIRTKVVGTPGKAKGRKAA